MYCGGEQSAGCDSSGIIYIYMTWSMLYLCVTSDIRICWWLQRSDLLVHHCFTARVIGEFCQFFR